MGAETPSLPVFCTWGPAPSYAQPIQVFTHPTSGPMPPSLAKAPESPPQPGHCLDGPLRPSLATEADARAHLLLHCRPTNLLVLGLGVRVDKLPLGRERPQWGLSGQDCPVQGVEAMPGFSQVQDNLRRTVWLMHGELGIADPDGVEERKDRGGPGQQGAAQTVRRAEELAKEDGPRTPAGSPVPPRVPTHDGDPRVRPDGDSSSQEVAGKQTRKPCPKQPQPPSCLGTLWWGPAMGGPRDWGT